MGNFTPAVLGKIQAALTADPLGETFAASLARPGGYATGFTNVEATMGGKWLELLKEIAPHVRRVGVLFNPRVAVAGGSFFVQPLEAKREEHGSASEIPRKRERPASRALR